MNTYIIAWHADSDDVNVQLVHAESWQDVLRHSFDTTFPILATFSLTQEEAAENGFFITIKEIEITPGHLPTLRSIL